MSKSCTVYLLPCRFNTILSLHIFFCISLLPSCSQPEEEVKKSGPLFDYEVIASDLMIPWNIEVGPDNYLWATDQVKKVIRISLRDYSQQVLELQNFERDSFYMMGMTFHPEFTENGVVFLGILYPPISEGSTSYLDVIAAKYDGNTNTITQTSVVIDSLHTMGSNNAGGRMIITEDQKLLVVASCETEVMDAQDVSNLSGKTLRFNLDGSIPADNPFKGSPIYTLGHRNPQGMILMKDGSVYISEHGPSTDDEFNKLEKGANYGWPIVRGVCDSEQERATCDSINIHEALCFWTPTIAPSSLLYYDYPRLPALKDKFLVSTLKENDIRVLNMNEDGIVTKEAVLFDQNFGRIRDMAVDTSGNLYFSTANILPFTRNAYDHMPKDTTLRYDVIIKVFAQLTHEYEAAASK